MLIHGELSKLVAQQGWNNQSLITMLASFVEDNDLEDRFLAYAQEVAEVENLPAATVRDGEVTALFTCPKCGGHRLAEICVGSVVTSEVTSVAKDDGGNVVVDYAPAVAAESGALAEYQCGDCRHTLPIAPDPDCLFDYLFPGEG
jgi:hypothetical protein